MNLLVVGLLSRDAGKTTAVRAILADAVRDGRDVVPCKPRSASNLWDHADHAATIRETGRLVSRDALGYVDLLDDPPPLEQVNPVHQLAAPVDLDRVDDVDRLAAEDVAVAERLSVAGEGSLLYLSETWTASIADEALVEAIRDRADRVETVGAGDDPDPPYAEAARAALDALREGGDLVVESRTDRPWPTGLDPGVVDRVVAVAPTLALVADPTAVHDAVRVAGAATARQALGYVDVEERVDLPVLTSGQRSDPDALVAAYGALLDALG